MNDSVLRPAAAETVPPRADSASPRRSRRSLIIKLLIGLVAAAAAVAVVWPWLAERWAHVSVDDARIGASLVTLSSSVSDMVTEVLVDTGDHVSAGALLVAIDSATTTLELSQVDAEIEALASQQAQLRAQEDLLQKQLQSRSDAAAAQLAAARADWKSANAAFANAKSAFDRVSALRQRQVAAAQEFDQAQAAFIQAEQQELHAEAAVRSAEASAAGVEADRAQTAVLERQIEGLGAQIKAKQAERGQKLIEAGQHAIKAAFDGVIDATFVHAGENVTPGQRILIYHDPGKVWVDANIKETDVRKVKVGAPATISVDAYPGQVFQGHVAAMSNATTSQFALLPSPNPSGNFTKVTQRVPIKIAVDQRDDQLRPGMMVEASIDVVH